MLWIGLTGGIASGKSTVAEQLRELGHPVVDADAVARQVVEPGEEGAKALLHLVGPSYFDRQGRLDRKKLGALIFSDPGARRDVEQILHPLIQQQVAKQRKQLQNQGVKMAFYEVPLLFEKNLQDRFDHILLVFAPEGLQLERLMKREGLSREEAQKRLASQIPMAQKLPQADTILDNTGGPKQLKEQLLEILSALEARAAIDS